MTEYVWHLRRELLKYYKYKYILLASLPFFHTEISFTVKLFLLLGSLAQLFVSVENFSPCLTLLRDSVSPHVPRTHKGSPPFLAGCWAANLVRFLVRSHAPQQSGTLSHTLALLWKFFLCLTPGNFSLFQSVVGPGSKFRWAFHGGEWGVWGFVAGAKFSATSLFCMSCGRHWNDATFMTECRSSGKGRKEFFILISKFSCVWVGDGCPFFSRVGCWPDGMQQQRYTPGWRIISCLCVNL